MKKGYKECPFCANEIKEKAIKCQYCGEFLPEKEKKEEKRNKKQENFLKDCPFCLNKIDIDTVQCPFCDENIDSNCNKNEETEKTDGLLNNEELDKNKLKSCIKIGQKWIKNGRLAIVGPLCVIAFSFLSFFVSSDSYEKLMTIIGFIVFFLIRVGLYFLFWLVKNYRFLLKLKSKGLSCDSLFVVVFYWIFPLINLIKPKKIIEDIFSAYGKLGEENIKQIKIQGCAWCISFVSFCLMFFYPVWLSVIGIICFIISHGVQLRYMVKIVNNIVNEQKKYIGE